MRRTFFNRDFHPRSNYLRLTLDNKYDFDFYLLQNYDIGNEKIDKPYLGGRYVAPDIFDSNLKAMSSRALGPWFAKDIAILRNM